jgi:hypothetical protein
MAVLQFDSLKQLSFSHECYHSDDYFREQFIFFFPSVGRAGITSISYFPLNHVEVWTGIVWLMIESLNIVQLLAIIFCKRRVLCFGVSFVLVIL